MWGSGQTTSRGLAKWQATGWSVPRSTSSGSSIAQMSWAIQQRVRKRQPDGGSIGLGTSPNSLIRLRARSRSGSGIGIADSSAWVYGCAGDVVDLVAGADLDDLAEVHHGDTVGDVAHHRQVVGDEQVGQPELVLQLLEEVDDAGLDADVERRHRLVEDDELRLDRQRPGDADALALAAGELVRVAVGVLGRQADELQQLLNARPAPAPWSIPRWTRSASPIARSMFLRGLSEAYGSWNTICARWRNSIRASPLERRRCRCPRRGSGRTSAGSAAAPAGRSSTCRTPTRPTSPSVSPG